MEGFQLLASPFWVNLAIFVPLVLWFVWQKGLRLTKHQLTTLALFGIAFGITEAVVVVYLRTIGQSAIQTLAFSALPQNILAIEVLREVCTMVMLVTLAMSSAQTAKERLILFLYTFAVWDLVYYAGLKLLVNWPESLTTQDVLFLIPIPWLSQVWFPILISSLIILVVLVKNKISSGYFKQALILY